MQDTAPHPAEGPLEQLEGPRVCHGQTPLQPPALSSPAAIPLSVLLSSSWKGLIQPPTSLGLLGYGFPPGSLSSAPRAAPCPGAAGAHAQPWLLAAASFYAPAATRAVTSPSRPGSARGKGRDGEASGQACSLPLQLG